MLQHEYELITMSLGENIKRLRRDKKWTQQELAEKADVQMGHVSKLERNESDPKLETIYKLMAAFECSPNALLNDVKKTQLDGRVEMALERVQGLPEEDKKSLLNVIDKYCIAISLQSMLDNSAKAPFGLNRSQGSTEELG